MIRVTWHPLAKRELFDGADFYDGRVTDLGEIFLSTIETVVAAIRRNPRSSPIIRSQIRRRVVPRFPYHVIYRVEAERIFILALAHQKRRPFYWARRG